MVNAVVIVADAAHPWASILGMLLGFVLFLVIFVGVEWVAAQRRRGRWD